MYKVFLTASNTVFGADKVVGQNYWILSIKYLASEVYRLIKLAEYFLLNSPYSLLAIHLTGFSVLKS